MLPGWSGSGSGPGLDSAPQSRKMDMRSIEYFDPVTPNRKKWHLTENGWIYRTFHWVFSCVQVIFKSF